MSVNKGALPDNALLQEYVRRGAYTDCYQSTVEGNHSHADFVVAFYTTWLFRLERFILAWLVARPSSDLEAQEVANNERATFAAWRVEARDNNQLLMCDFRDRTRSWFMVEHFVENQVAYTRLYFGSAVVPVTQAEKGGARFSFLFRVLLGFHRVYSRALLNCAGSRLTR